MIATIEGKEYNLLLEWSEISLQKYIELCNIEIPDKLRELWKVASEKDDKNLLKIEESIGIEETEKIFPKYYGEIIKCLSDIPEKIIERFDSSLREELFNSALRHLVFSTFTLTPVDMVKGELVPFEPDNLQSFVIKNQEYFLPNTLRLYGEEIPMGEEEIITFAEASDIEIALQNLATGAVDRLPMFCAVYCRPKGEKYDEIKTINRAKLFEQMAMNMVWEVFFCIAEHQTKYQQFTHEYLRGVQRLMRESDNQDSTILDGEEQSTKLHREALTVQLKK